MLISKMRSQTHTQAEGGKICGRGVSTLARHSSNRGGFEGIGDSVLGSARQQGCHRADGRCVA